MSYTLRSVLPSDYQFLLDLHMDTMKDYLQQQLGMDKAQQEVRWKEDFDTEAAKWNIVVVDGENAGLVWVMPKDEVFFPLTHNNDIAPNTNIPIGYNAGKK